MNTHFDFSITPISTIKEKQTITNTLENVILTNVQIAILINWNTRNFVDNTHRLNGFFLIFLFFEPHFDNIRKFISLDLFFY